MAASSDTERVSQVTQRFPSSLGDNARYNVEVTDALPVCFHSNIYKKI